MELSVATASGERRPCELRIGALRADGELAGGVSLVRDVDDESTGGERAELQREIRERERRLSRLIDNVPGMVYRCRNERGWPMTFVSDACREITGYPPEALERGAVEYGSDAMHDDDREPVWETIQSNVTDREPFSVSYRIVTAEGGDVVGREPRPRPVRGRGGVRRVCGRRRRADTEHGRRTARGLPGRDPARYVRVGRPLDGGTDVRADLWVELEEHEATLTVGDLPLVEGDASQLRQVFQNLLENAIEYSGDDSASIHVDVDGPRRESNPTATCAAERNGAEWVVSVADDGVGFDPDQSERVFEMFERLGRDDGGGTGIGLTLCERIVDRHGGEIWVDSAPDEGSTFHFTPPALEADSERD